MRALAALIVLALPLAAAAETLRGPGYEVKVDAPVPPRAGAKARATVHITPADGWKLNQEYPFKIVLTAGAGVKAAKALAKGDARHFDEHGADIDVVFTVDKPGKAELAGVIRFATCSADTCEPHKQAFTITATAK